MGAEASSITEPSGKINSGISMEGGFGADSIPRGSCGSYFLQLKVFSAPSFLPERERSLLRRPAEGVSATRFNFALPNVLNRLPIAES